jgi:hypothetical protein
MGGSLARLRRWGYTTLPHDVVRTQRIHDVDTTQLLLAWGNTQRTHSSWQHTTHPLFFLSRTQPQRQDMGVAEPMLQVEDWADGTYVCI